MGTSAWEKYKRDTGYAGSNNTAQQKTTAAPSVNAWEKYKRDTGYSADVDKSFIDSFISDANAFYSSANKDYESVSWNNASVIAESKRKTLSDLDYRRNVISNWLENNKSNFTQDSYQAMRDMLDSYSKDTKSILSGFNEAARFYSLFQSEDAYQKWQQYSTTDGRQEQYAKNQIRLQELKKTCISRLAVAQKDAKRTA